MKYIFYNLALFLWRDVAFKGDFSLHKSTDKDNYVDFPSSLEFTFLETILQK